MKNLMPRLAQAIITSEEKLTHPLNYLQDDSVHEMKIGIYWSELNSCTGLCIASLIFSLIGPISNPGGNGRVASTGVVFSIICCVSKYLASANKNPTQGEDAIKN
jgi:hypothetical protein